MNCCWILLLLFLCGGNFGFGGSCGGNHGCGPKPGNGKPGNGWMPGCGARGYGRDEKDCGCDSMPSAWNDRGPGKECVNSMPPKPDFPGINRGNDTCGCESDQQ